MPRTFAIAAFAVIVAAGLWALQAFAADSPKQGAAAAEAFNGKLVLVYFKGRTADHIFTIEKVTFEELNGMKMLRGVHADSSQEPNWMRGRETKVAMDSVESLTIYESLEDYKKAIAPFQDDAL